MRVVVGVGYGIGGLVTAIVLRNQGFSVRAVHLGTRIAGGVWPCAENDQIERLTAYSKICKKFDIEWIVKDVSPEFEAFVLDPAVVGALQQRVPYPCLNCQFEVKLTSLFAEAKEWAAQLGASVSADEIKIATGHSAQHFEDPAAGLVRLMRGSDPERDQSFFLHRLKQKQLRQFELPLGAMPWAQIIKIAQSAAPGEIDPAAFLQGTDCGLRSPCAVADARWPGVVEARTALTLRSSGSIETLRGESMGQHDGFHRYRIGTRQGLDHLLVEKPSWVAVGFDLSRHSIQVGPPSHLEVKEAFLGKMSWIVPMDGFKETFLDIRFSPLGEFFKARVLPLESDGVRLEFDQPQKGILVGGPAAIYDGDEVLGGGVIERVQPPPAT